MRPRAALDCLTRPQHGGHQPPDVGKTSIEDDEVRFRSGHGAYRYSSFGGSLLFLFHRARLATFATSCTAASGAVARLVQISSIAMPFTCSQSVVLRERPSDYALLGSVGARG